MNCPRCQSKTDRTVIYITRPAGLLGVAVRSENPLICTRCLDDIEVRSAMGELMVWDTADLPVVEVMRAGVQAVPCVRPT